MHKHPTTLFLPALSLCLLLSAAAATAQTTPAASPPATAAAGSAACVEVEVNGVRSQSFSCLTEKLKPSSPAPASRPDQPMASEQIANQPGNQLGVYNAAALSNRMGNTLGTSVYPQRPATGR